MHDAVLGVDAESQVFFDGVGGDGKSSVSSVDVLVDDLSTDQVP